MHLLTPFIGAAIADSSWGKYKTIVLLSFVYVFGVLLTALFAVPTLFGFGPGSVGLIGVLVGLVLVSIGTGGIKPCVSAHGGDQFLDIQVNQLNSFYNYFYLAINAGSLIAGFLTPAIVDRQCFGQEKDCYAYAYGLCGVIMLFAVIVIMAGRQSYRIEPAAGVFLPWKVCKCIATAFKKWRNAPKSVRFTKKGMLDFAEPEYPREFIDEVRDLVTMFWVL